MSSLKKCKNRTDLDKSLQILSDPSFMPAVPANLLYSSDGCLLRVMADDVKNEASKILNDGTEEVQLRKIPMANGSMKYFLPKHMIKYSTKLNLQDLNKYIGQVNMKVQCADKSLYEGELTDQIEIPYVFPEMDQIMLEATFKDKKLEQTVENIKPYDRITCNIIEKKINQEI